ncbi:MAG: hypothetical protein RL518_2363 [Pseudomonadota bacterium]|jgi:methionyl-tRNA formyltransferase
MTVHVIACSTPWFAGAEKGAAFRKHSFVYVDRKEDLSIEYLNEIRPRYVFFPHWSWIVPPDVIQKYECVCFHSTPLPYGRGGSPIQNMIERGHATSKVSALRMTTQLDAGPVYMQRDLSLSGSADEIFKRVALLIQDMIPEIIETAPTPVPQVGEPTVFKRRTPDQSALPSECAISKIYDHIRMLDAEGYPKAFLSHGDFTLEFDGASLVGDEVEARVVIRKRSS